MVTTGHPNRQRVMRKWHPFAVFDLGLLGCSVSRTIEGRVRHRTVPDVEASLWYDYECEVFE
jgi:hypothetical protein